MNASDLLKINNFSWKAMRNKYNIIFQGVL